MGKTPCCEKNGLKKGPWTVEEDQKLIDYIRIHGYGRWRMLPKNAGLKRCGKSCRLRWTNYLRPDIKRGRFSIEEEEIIMQLHSVLGNKWSTIAAQLPGRTDNEIKNFWNTNIRKKLIWLGIDPVTHTPSLDLLQLSSFLSSSLHNFPYHDQVLNHTSSLGSIQSTMNPNLQSLANAIFSSQCKNPDFISQNLQNNQFCAPQIQENPHQSPNVQEIQACAASSASSGPYLSGTQLMQVNLESFSQAPSKISYQNDLPNYLWQNNGDILPNYGYNYSTNQSITNPLSESQQIFQSNNNDIESIHNSGFGSVLSTPSSSQTYLNSSSITCVNGSTTEDENDSFCSNMLMFGVPNRLHVDGFM